MEHLSDSLFLLLLLIIVLIFSARHLDSEWPKLERALRDDLRGWMPVYSAETTDGKEAEFIRDRLPKKLPAMIVLLAVIVFAALAWWLTR
jgi:flagellar biogenesis protein FliO